MQKLLLGLLFISFQVAAQEVVIYDFNNWKLTDISKTNTTKEKLFTSMNRDFIKLGGSICSNRALIWAYDFKRFNNVDAGKVFLFYTKKNGEVGRKTWWYHVSPVVNENGSIYTLDAGFPGNIKGPLLTLDWLEKFTGSRNCKEIRATDTDLLKKMFDGYVYPQTTSHGTYDCYYIYAPAAYWTPSSVAKGLLGVDENDVPVHYVREQFNTNELYQACVEAVTSSAGRFFGGGKKRCKDYLQY